MMRGTLLKAKADETMLRIEVKVERARTVEMAARRRRMLVVGVWKGEKASRDTLGKQARSRMGRGRFVGSSGYSEEAILMRGVEGVRQYERLSDVLWNLRTCDGTKRLT